MNINRNNFESFFLDYFDGKLEPAEVDALFFFLSKHPDLEDNFREFDPLLIVEKESLFYPEKDELKRGFISNANAQFYLAAFGEGDLDDSDAKMVVQFADENPWFEKQLRWILAARLKPDPKISFPNKGNLKHPPILQIQTKWMRITSIAATIAALVVAFVFLQTRQMPPDPLQVVQQRPIQPHPDDKIEPKIVDINLDENTGSNLIPITTSLDLDRSSTNASNEIIMHYLPEIPKKVSIVRMESLQGMVVLSETSRNLHSKDFMVDTHALMASVQTEESNQQTVQGFRDNLTTDLQRIEERLNTYRPQSLLELAEASFWGINHLLGSPVTVTRRIDQDGKSMTVSIGQHLEFTRVSR